MWHPTNSNTESDNKKLEQVVTAVAANTAATSLSSSSDHNTTDFNNFGNNNSNKKDQQQYDECIDSGICSGQLTSSSNIDSTEFEQSQSQQQAEKHFNIPPKTASEQFKQKQQEQTTLDSGCIVSEPISGYIEFEELPENANPMILKNNADANISEWFCNLSLQTDQTGETNTTSGLNNLNTRAPNSNQRNRQQQQQQHTTATTINLNASNAWERFYQQNDEGDTALHVACALGEEDIVAALIRMVPNPCLFNIQNDEGQTPIHIAARAQQPKILRMLLIAGAEPLIRDCRGNTALHLACDVGEMQCVSALTASIAQSEVNEAHRQYGHRDANNKESSLRWAQLPPDLEIRNYDGLRCVHIAAQSGHLEIMRLLEFYGADMNSKEGLSGYTPLHIAIINNNDEIINFLLNECKSLNIEAETYAGRTAYQIADELEKYQMTNILKQRGAEPLTPPESEYETSDLESDDEKESNWFGEHRLMSNFTLMVA